MAKTIYVAEGCTACYLLKQEKKHRQSILEEGGEGLEEGGE